MTQHTPSKLQILWERFLQAECASYEKSTWFDGFLTEFLVQYKDGKSIQDILPFTPLPGVATLIGCELLSDVHQICSQPGDGEDLAPLRRHLLRGRGWRTLAVLHCLSVQDVSCGLELATLLVSLYPVCLQTLPHKPSRKSGASALSSPSPTVQKSAVSSNPRNPYVSLKGCWNRWVEHDDTSQGSPGQRGYSLPGLVRLSPSDGVHYRKWSTSSRPGSFGMAVPQQTRLDQAKNHNNSSSARLRRRSRNTMEAESPKGFGNTIQNITSESEAPQDASEVLLNKSNTLKIRLDPMDFGYFESVVRSEDELQSDQPFWRNPTRRGSRKINAEDLTDDKMREVRAQTISSAEFCLLVVHLLEELCRTELPLSSHQVSLQAVNFSLENLCSLQFGSTPLDTLSSEEVTELKLAMTQLLLTALDKVLMQPDVISQLINAGVLPVMLRVLEDAVRKAEVANSCQKTSSVSVSEEKDTVDESSGLQEFVMGVLYGAVTFLHCLLLHRSSTERIHEFEEQFRLFASSYNNRLIEKTVFSLMNYSSPASKAPVTRAKKVVILVVQLILSLKQARSTVVHSLQCRKTRHKHCKAVDSRRHHHNDLFGNPSVGTAVGSMGVGNPSNTCNVAYLYAALVRILNSSNHLPDFSVHLMKVMLECGTCCCYPAKALLSCLTKVFRVGGAKARALGFTLLEHTAFTELGASETSQLGYAGEYFRCSVCNRSVESLSTQTVAEDDEDVVHCTSSSKMSGKEASKYDSERLSVSSICSEKSENTDFRGCNWNCLDFYRELLCSDDPKLCHTATIHLLKLAPRCNEKVQLALLSNVFYPSFLHAKNLVLEEETDVSKFIVLSCLSAFSCLISSVSLAETFISLGGLQHVLDLMLVPPFLKKCCSVLEIVIVVELLDTQRRRRTDGKYVPTTPANVGSLPVKSSPNSKINQLSSLRKLVESLELCSNELVEKLKLVENLDDSDDSSINRRSRLKSLQNVAVLWQTVANLALCSPSLRHYFASHPISSMGFVLLRRILLRVLSEPGKCSVTSTNRDTERFLYLRLLESILVLHFTAPPISSDSDVVTSRDKMVSDLENTLCRPELLSLCGRSHGSAGSLRRLCDTLVRCALAEASTDQVMPTVRKAKLPALMVAEVCSEEAEETEERSPQRTRKHQDSWRTVSGQSFDINGEMSKHEQECHSEDGSSVEDPYVTADEGYEADVEVLEKKRNGASMIYDSSSSGSCGQQGSLNLGDAANKSSSIRRRKHTNTIAHPSLCSVPVNLLVYLYQEVRTLENTGKQAQGQNIEETNSSRKISLENEKEIIQETKKNKTQDDGRARSLSGPQKTEDDKSDKPRGNSIESQLLSDMVFSPTAYRGSLSEPQLSPCHSEDMRVHILQRLVALCRESGRNCMTLAQGGMITTLLTGFNDILSRTASEITELQSVVLELFGLLAQHSITSQELAQYLTLFKTETDRPPLEALLQPLTTLVTSARPQPNYILCFPVPAFVEEASEAGDSNEPVNTGSELRQRKSSGLLSVASNIGISSTRSSFSGESGSQAKSFSETVTVENAAVVLAQSLRSQHTAAGISSAWTNCAIALPIDADLGWSMWLHGFSLSLWLRMERASAPESTPQRMDQHPGLHRNYSGHQSDSLSDSWSEWGIISSASWLKDGGKPSDSQVIKGRLHLVSIGTDSMLLEIWVDVNSDLLHLKLSRTDSKTTETLSECVTEDCLPTGQWHHLAFNVRDYVQRKKNVIEVTIIVDGWHEMKSLLTFNGLLIRKAKPTCVLVGHTVSTSVNIPTPSVSPSRLAPNLGSWYLGSLQLFRSPVFTRERAIYLVGLGPSHTSLTDCKVGRDNPNFTNIFGPKILNSGVAWDIILDNGVTNLKELQDNLLIAYSAQNPTTLNVYPQVVGSSSAGMGSLFPGQPGFRVVTPDHRASQQLPLALRPTLFGPLNTQQYRGLVSAVSILGGAPVFLFLFARVVELRASEVEQAKALYLLLKLVQSDTSLFSQFVQQDCHKLLLKVLSSERCIPGHHVLKAVLDACCDKPVLQHQPGPQCQFRIVQQSEAIVVNSFLLSTIVGSWRDWERVSAGAEDGGVLGTLFRALHVLLRDDHSYREFNASQLNRVRLVEALLLFCKERFLYEEWQPLHPSVCCSLVELVRSLMGAPPEFAHIVAVADCLLLLHPASLTYITHVRPSFYFLLSPTPPAPSPTPQRKRGTRSGLFGFGDIEAKAKMLKKKGAGQAGITHKETSGTFTQPVDPCKLNKALTNLQIKRSTDEGRDKDSNFMMTVQTNHNGQFSVMDSNKVEEGNEPNFSDIDGDVVDGCSELTAFDSGIAGSFREHTGSSDAEVREVHEGEGEGEGYEQGKKQKQTETEYVDRADFLIAQAEGVKFFEREAMPKSPIDNNLEKFTTEMDMKEKQYVLDWTQKSSSVVLEDYQDQEESTLNMAARNAGNTSTSTSADGVKPNSSKSKSSQCLVVEGLLLLLRDTLLVLPDNMASQVLNHVVQAETLLVMANNSDARVRSAVVKVLGAYLQRATDEELNKFLKMKGFYQLASQLGLYTATPELVESCAALITQRGDTSLEELLVTLTEQLDLDQLTMSPLQLSAFPPILGLLPRAIHDLVLCHNTLAFVREVITQVAGAFRPLLDAGLLEVLLKVLVLVAHLPPEPTDIMGSSEQDLLISDINVFLCSIIGHILNTPGTHLMQVLNDMQLQLTFLQQLETSSCGAASRCVGVLHDTHCTILESALDMILEKLTVQHCHMKGRSLLSASYDDKLGWSRGGDSTHLRVPLSSLSLSNHSSFSAQSGSMLRSKSAKDVSRSEIYERFKTVIVKAVEFLIHSEPCDNSIIISSEVQQTFSRHLFSTLLQGLSSIQDRRGIDSKSKSMWSGAMWAARDTLRVRGAQLVVWFLSPKQPLKMRMFAVHSLRAEPRAKELLSSMLHTHSQIEQKFTVWLWVLLYGSGSHELPPADVRACEELKEQLQRWGVLSPHAVGHAHDNWSGEVTLLLREAERQQAAYVAHNQDAMERSVHKMEPLQHTLVDEAMAATRNVVEAQNSERKAFMEHIKSTYSENVQLRIKWQHIIQLLTHERAVWFFPDSHPVSWQLDATEGPARVRKRLQRCHLNLKDKFLMKDQQEKLEHALRPGPLNFLFEHDSNTSSTSSVMIERLHMNEKIQHMCTAHVITPACEIPGELLIGESCLYFVTDDSALNDLCEVTAGSLDMSSTAWQFEDVKEIINRRYQLQERAFEIFLLNGRTYLVAFESAEDRDAFLSELSQCELLNRMQADNLSDVVEMWREGTITNWEYLTQLNKMAGRSYNDLMQYPVFPFVLADYTSSVLDLSDPKSYRNFKKPMAIQNKSNEQHYIDTYNYVKQELLEGLGQAGRHEPYHYGSHYSNSGIVLHFLVRLPPFTRMFLNYQDDNFDLPDRTFHSLHTTWRLTSSDSTTDVKEIIPEFFFLPEFLLNNEGFDFGVRQSGERVDSVQLPPWCGNDARLFILIHRQGLESACVRENLPHWVDLVFGYKQTGKAAVEAINVFHPATYCGFDVSSIKDPLERTARETMVRTYGQMPRQLFRTLHPMAVQSLTSRAVSYSVPPVLRSVHGLSWGSYVGSPADPEPILITKHQHRTLVANLVPLHSNDVFGVAPHSSILLCYSKDKVLSLVNSSAIQSVALATWCHADSIVRVKLKKELPPWPVFRAPELDPICVCASVPDCNQLWMGHISGRLVVNCFTFEAVRGQLDFSSEPVTLLGHTAPILGIHLSRSFSIAVSASQDNTAIIWDLNSLSYVRTITFDSPVSLVSVSETLGDIVTVCHASLPSETSENPQHTYNPWKDSPCNSSTDMKELSSSSGSSSPLPNVLDDWEVLHEAETCKVQEHQRATRSYSWSLKGLPKLRRRESRLSQNAPPLKSSQSPSPTFNLPIVKGSTMYLHSVNATAIGSVYIPEQITAVCFSSAPEGISVNVIATGLFSGVIRLWSTWDLSPIRDIQSPGLTHPIISLTYSHDSQHLYASSSDGVVAIWEGGGAKGSSKTTKFFNLTSL